MPRKPIPVWTLHDPHDPDHWQLELSPELFLVLRCLRHRDKTLDKWVMEVEHGGRLGPTTPLKGKKLQTVQREAVDRLYASGQALLAVLERVTPTPRGEP